ncbi:MAG: hypothetical protein HKN33_18325 [Pyrinomonadaceae bacterium]|nr:hypothetical protein [Pyrinomonadaceae bacterium]
MKILTIAVTIMLLQVLSFAQELCKPKAFPQFEFSKENVFPADKSLKRPEDGKMLPDGRIVVGDDDHGLRVIEKDGKHRPFGKFKEAGYKNAPPDQPGAPNGVFLESNGKYLLVADVYTGFIYRVDVKTEESRIIYRHEYGVNSVLRETDGTIWFTQSAKNNLSTGSAALYSVINEPEPTGAVFRLEGAGFDVNGRAKMVADGIFFANGIAMSKDRLFVAETMLDRVLVYNIDRKSVALRNRQTYTNVLSPDNLLADNIGNLYIASPVSNSVFAVDAKCESLHRVFSAPSASNTKAQDAWVSGSRTGKPLITVLSPQTFEPMPGILTGMFLSHDGKSLYVTGLGNALVKN